MSCPASGGEISGGLVEHGDERFQLQARDVGPATAAFHGLQQAEKPLTVFGQAAAKGAVLNVAMQGFNAAQQSEQCLGIAFQFLGQAAQAVEQLRQSFLVCVSKDFVFGTGDGQRDGLLRAAKG